MQQKSLIALYQTYSTIMGMMTNIDTLHTLSTENLHTLRDNLHTLSTAFLYL